MPESDWKLLVNGAHNTVYINAAEDTVLKVKVFTEDMEDDPVRSVRLWNLINSHISPPAEVYKNGNLEGWTSPYIKGKQAPDQEIAIALLDIFNKTGRIVVDATNLNNFLKTEDNKVVCVDIGFAFQLEKEDNPLFPESRRKSLQSLDAWERFESLYIDFLYTDSFTNPITVNMVRALLFIKTYCPAIVDASFLVNNSDLVAELASAYVKQFLNKKNGHFSPQSVQHFIRHLQLKHEPFTVPLTSDNVSAEIKNFTTFVLEQVPTLIKGGDIEDVTLSKPYEKSGREYIDLQISNPEVLDLYNKFSSNNSQNKIQSQTDLKQNNSAKTPYTHGIRGLSNRFFEAIGSDKRIWKKESLKKEDEENRDPKYK